jgi:hypothetical protein
MEFYVFDLDGTLALIHHRQHMVRDGNRDWDGFYAACVDDDPHAPVIRVFQDLLASGAAIEIWSGRSAVVEDETVAWLTRELGVVSAEDIRAMLRMRPDKDYTPDHELKLSWLNETRAAGRHVLMVFDDRQKVVDMWRSEGVTCAQVAPGDF